jgi:hypothetical protein
VEKAETLNAKAPGGKGAKVQETFNTQHSTFNVQGNAKSGLDGVSPRRGGKEEVGMQNSGSLRTSASVKTTTRQATLRKRTARGHARPTGERKMRNIQGPMTNRRGGGTGIQQVIKYQGPNLFWDLKFLWSLFLSVFSSLSSVKFVLTG